MARVAGLAGFARVAVLVRVPILIGLAQLLRWKLFGLPRLHHCLRSVAGVAGLVRLARLTGLAGLAALEAVWVA